MQTKNKPEHVAYIEGKGGRKTAVANARIVKEGKGFFVNDKDFRTYFKMPKLQAVAHAPFDVLKVQDQFGATVHVAGGGIHAQAEAVRNAIAKALVKIAAEFKKRLRREGFITRDSRMVERKKYGLKKARRAPQWQKR